jgi:hypothetical protein
MSDTEPTRRDWWIATSRAVLHLLEDNPALPEPYSYNMTERIVRWYTHDAEETRTALRVLGGGEKFDADGAPGARGESHGLRWEVVRLGMSCELVETDELVEVDEVEVVRPAETRTVTVQRPKLRKVCPPILADDELAQALA